MATLSIEDIQSVDAARFSWNRRRRGAGRPPFAPSRRELIRGAVGAGAIVSLGVLGSLPTARPAYAAPPDGWKIWEGCSGLGSWVNNDDCRGCNQGSSLCCCTSGGFHREDGCRYNYRADQCKSGGYDGWTWSTGLCCTVSSPNCGSGCARAHVNVRWRCSDGYTRSSCSNEWTTSICRWILSRGAACGPCAC